MANKIITLRESLDEYKRRISQEGFSEDRWRNQSNFPYDNHIFAMKASSDLIKRVFEESEQFKFVESYIFGTRQGNIWDCLPTDALIISNNMDQGSIDPACFCETYGLNEGWIPMSIHPNHSSRISALSETNPEEYFKMMEKLGENSVFTGAIETLERLLSVAEKYKIPMVTGHKNGKTGGTKPLVSYLPGGLILNPYREEK